MKPTTLMNEILSKIASDESATWLSLITAGGVFAEQRKGERMQVIQFLSLNSLIVQLPTEYGKSHLCHYNLTDAGWDIVLTSTRHNLSCIDA